MEIKFYYVGGACFVLDIDKKIKIACDPFLNPVGTEYNFKAFKRGPDAAKIKRIKAPIYNDSLFENVDIWLVSHGHDDHIDELGLSKMDENSLVITCKSAIKKLSNKKFSNLWVANWGNEKIFNFGEYKVMVEAVPAFHGNNLIMRTISGKVNGYYVTILRGDEKKSIYVTSDTVYHDRIVKSLENKKIDVMLANLGNVCSNIYGGPFTLSISMLNQMVNKLKPLLVIPIHYDDFSHFETPKDEIIHEGYRTYDPGTWFSLFSI